jgi:hypothetical protein
MGRELEIGSAGIPGEAHLQQRLHLIHDIRKNLGLCYAGNCHWLAAIGLVVHRWTLAPSPLAPGAKKHQGHWGLQHWPWLTPIQSA